jgi:hypothetical protein
MNTPTNDPLANLHKKALEAMEELGAIGTQIREAFADQVDGNHTGFRIGMEDIIEASNNLERIASELGALAAQQTNLTSDQAAS